MLKTKFLAVAALFAVGMAAAQTAPYAGQNSRQIKSLSDKDVQDLLTGQGAGLAKAAELNGYPGPAHVLEHAQALQLTSEQRTLTTALMREHKAKARETGSRLVDAEHMLDHAFVSRAIDETLLRKLTADVATLQAELRSEHLRTHLTQTALLTHAQVQHYQELRGYVTAPESEPRATTGHGKHH